MPPPSSVAWLARCICSVPLLFRSIRKGFALRQRGRLQRTRWQGLSFGLLGRGLVAPAPCRCLGARVVARFLFSMRCALCAPVGRIKVR